MNAKTTLSKVATIYSTSRFTIEFIVQFEWMFSTPFAREPTWSYTSMRISEKLVSSAPKSLDIPFSVMFECLHLPSESMVFHETYRTIENRNPRFDIVPVIERQFDEEMEK
jgi:hypothetical protein